MKTRLLSFVFVFVAAASVAQAQTPAGSTTLTNASVVKLVRAGFKEKTVIAIINARPVSFDLSPDRLIELKKGGVPERVILAMLARAESVDFASDGWDEDEMPFGGFGREGGRQGSQGASGRIIKPPTEAGGSAKLERTPTLTNDSVVELVEAGFSEGTIVRRIEQSPVEFDLSPEKLAELRKRRVTEPVINAMRAAMGEDEKEPARPER